jgi:hypothetical protein
MFFFVHNQYIKKTGASANNPYKPKKAGKLCLTQITSTYSPLPHVNSSPTIGPTVRPSVSHRGLQMVEGKSERKKTNLPSSNFFFVSCVCMSCGNITCIGSQCDSLMHEPVSYFGITFALLVNMDLSHKVVYLSKISPQS